MGRYATTDFEMAPSTGILAGCPFGPSFDLQCIALTGKPLTFNLVISGLIRCLCSKCIHHLGGCCLGLVAPKLCCFSQDFLAKIQGQLERVERLCHTRVFLKILLKQLSWIITVSHKTSDLEGVLLFS